MRTNAISWNPMEAFVFLAANEDYNVYSFDVRLVPHAVLDLKFPKNLCCNMLCLFWDFSILINVNFHFNSPRALKRPLNVHMDHISAVTDVDYAPTGREFVTGSYDKTVSNKTNSV